MKAAVKVTLQALWKFVIQMSNGTKPLYVWYIPEVYFQFLVLRIEVPMVNLS